MLLTERVEGGHGLSRALLHGEQIPPRRFILVFFDAVTAVREALRGRVGGSDARAKVGEV